MVLSCQKIIGIVAGTLLCVITLSFTIAYGVVLSKLNAIPEGDRCVAYEQYEYVEVYERWKFVLTFGTGMWGALTAFAILATIAGLHPALVCLQCLL